MYIRYIAVTLMVMLLLACADHKEQDVFVKTEQVGFVINIPLLNSPYESSEIHPENKIEEVSVLVFDNNDQSKTYLYRKKGRLGTTEIQGNNIQVKFTIALDNLPGLERYDFMVITDSEEVLTLIDGWENENKTKKDVCQVLRHEVAREVGWEIKGEGSRNIPMWGELEDMRISSGASYSVGLLRMLAKIDVMAGAEIKDRFKIRKVYLYNYHTTGYVVPDDDNLSYKVTDDGVRVIANRPTVDLDWEVVKNAPVVYELSDEQKLRNALTDCIYTFETLNTKEGFEDNMCLVVEALWNPDGGQTVTEPRYYRLDFANYKNGAIEDFTSIVRNHNYVVTITHISDEGYMDAEEAYRSLPGQVEAEIADWTTEDIEVSIDNEYFFSLDRHKLTFHANSSNNQNSKIIIQTNHPKGWTIEKITSDEAGDDETSFIESVTPMRWAPSGGESDLTKISVEIEFDMNGMPTDWETSDRHAYIHFVYGDNRYVMPVTQKGMPGIGYTSTDTGWMIISRFNGISQDDVGRYTLEQIMDYLNTIDHIDVEKYHIPLRSELMMLWVYERAYQDEVTELPYDPLKDAIYEGYEITAATTYWSMSKCRKHGDNLIWINMARGKVHCARIHDDNENYNKDEDEGVLGRQLRIVKKNPNIKSGDVVYPHTIAHEEGPVIISREQGRGVWQRAILEEYVMGRYEFSSSNAVAAMLQVDNEDAKEDKYYYQDINEVCAQKNTQEQSNGVEEWRLPTQCEMQLIYAMGGMERIAYEADLISFPSLYGFEQYNLFSFAKGENGTNPKYAYVPLSCQENGSGQLEPSKYWTSTRVSGTSYVPASRSVLREEVVDPEEPDDPEEPHWVVLSDGQTIAAKPPYGDDKGTMAKVRCVRTLKIKPVSPILGTFR